LPIKSALLLPSEARTLFDNVAAKFSTVAATRSLLLLVMLITVGSAPAAGLAQALSVDWKLYGFALVDGDSEQCFYDAKGITHEPEGHIRVWTKCLLKKDLDGIDIQKDFDGQILENTAQKVAHYYVPPIAEVQTIDAKQAVTVTLSEETANISNIRPHARIFYEFNCSERMLRALSITIQTNGKFGSSQIPGQWEYVAPETNAATLLKILCPLR
jgi:hypothetical protein